MCVTKGRERPDKKVTRESFLSLMVISDNSPKFNGIHIAASASIDFVKVHPNTSNLAASTIASLGPSWGILSILGM